MTWRACGVFGGDLIYGPLSTVVNGSPPNIDSIGGQKRRQRQLRGRGMQFVCRGRTRAHAALTHRAYALITTFA